MGAGDRKPGTNEVVDRFDLVANANPLGYLYLAQTWEYVRRYMEHGQQGLPDTPLRVQEVGLAQSLFHRMPWFSPLKEMRQRSRDMWRHPWGWVIIFLSIFTIPLLLLFGLFEYIPLRFAPEPQWPADIDAESKAA